MGLDECVITLDSLVYSGGQKINGIVSFVLDEPKKVYGISINVKGEAAVGWTHVLTVHGSDGKTTTKSTYYSGKQSYFNNEWYLVGKKSEEMELQIGEYKYPFTFDLPMNLPSSFEGTHGNIRYTIKVKFSRPWKFDYESKVAFIVIAPFDLNSANVQSPVRIEKYKMFGCCCCKSAPLTLTVAIPQTGFVPGQEIPIQIDCDNVSRVNIKSIKCSIQKVVNFHADSPRGTERTIHEVVKVESNPIKARNSLSSLLALKVPSIAPTGQRMCRIIDLDYDLKISAKSSGLYEDLDIVIPITIGTVPLMNAASAPTNAFNSGPSQIGWSAMPSGDCVSSIPPPSYEESQFESKPIQDKCTAHNTSYPIFSNLPSPSAPK